MPRRLVLLLLKLEVLLSSVKEIKMPVPKLKRLPLSKKILIINLTMARVDSLEMLGPKLV